MSRVIADAWTNTMSGADVDVVTFVATLLNIVARSGSVLGRVRSTTELEFDSAGDVSVIATDGAIGKFRMTCARLAVAFGAADQPTLLYGGVLTASVELGDGHLEAKLEFKNAQDGWFRVERTA